MIKILSYSKSGSRVAVRDFLTYPLPEECVLNGVILDANPIIDALRTLKNAKAEVFKDVSLVIDGSFVYTKKITVPGKLKKLTYDEVIRDEFAEISPDSENLICDHFLLSTNEDGSKDILACAVEYAHAQAYLGIFETVGIKLSSVHLGVLTVLQYVESNPSLKQMPFVLNVVDDVIQLSMIFQNGISVFQSRTRLYGDERATQVRSTLDGLSGIIQFNKSQNFADLTNCFYLGLSAADMDLVELNSTYPEINFSQLQIYKDVRGSEQLPPGAHFAFLNTLMPDSSTDLLSNIRMLEKAKSKKKPKNRWLPVLAGIIFVLVAIIVTLWLMVRHVEGQIDVENKYLNNRQTMDDRFEVERLKANTVRTDRLYAGVTARNRATEAKPQISSSLLSKIADVADKNNVQINGFNFNSDNKTVNFSCTTDTEQRTIRFVEALSREELIDTVYYTGFNTGSNGDILFTIEVIASGWGEEDTN